MSLLSRLADRLILRPSTHPVDADGRERYVLKSNGLEIETWLVRSPSQNQSGSAKKIIALKFPGAGGRAERGGPHPCELWGDVDAEIWTVNHAGYGGSSGKASLKNFADTCEDAFRFLLHNFPGNPILVIGNSLGCVSALYIGARFEIAGLFLRNPVPLARMISERPKYNWWNFGMAKHVAAQVPGELNAVENALQCEAPCFFVQSERDQVVPPKYQNLIINNYTGPKSVFTMRGVDHNESVPEDQHAEYASALEWFGEKIFKR